MTILEMLLVATFGVLLSLLIERLSAHCHCRDQHSQQAEAAQRGIDSLTFPEQGKGR